MDSFQIQAFHLAIHTFRLPFVLQNGWQLDFYHRCHFEFWPDGLSYVLGNLLDGLFEFWVIPSFASSPSVVVIRNLDQGFFCLVGHNCSWMDHLRHGDALSNRRLYVLISTTLLLNCAKVVLEAGVVEELCLAVAEVNALGALVSSLLSSWNGVE